MEQRSEEWFRARLGKVTASRICDVVASTRSGPSVSRANYIAELVAERLTGQPSERYPSSSMVWGTQTEPLARIAYERATGEYVDEVGFIEHLSIPMSGASPDGLVGLSGLVEFKCPNTSTHIQTLRDSKVPKKYISQMQWQMACTAREWCDFVSFDPRIPGEASLFIRRIERDEGYISELEAAVLEFIGEVDATVEAILAPRI